MTPPIPLHFVTPVWGKAYTRTFLEVTLPTLLAPGNIPAVPNLADCAYRIHTTPADAETIIGSAAYARLSALLQVEFTYIPQLDGNKYVTSSDCYREGLIAASRAGAAVFTAVPDVIYADGGLASIVRLLRSGKRAVLVMGLRAVKETIVPELVNRFGGNEAVAVPARELVALLTRHLHPITESHLYEADTPTFHPSVLCWQVGKEGFLVHSFHLHPIAVHPATDQMGFTGTIDDDLVSSLGLRADEIHVADDSDEFLCVEISKRSARIAAPARASNLEIVSWMTKSTKDFHRSLVRRPLRLHSAGIAADSWRASESRARDVVANLLAAHARHINANRQGISLQFATAVWGEEYCRVFVEVTLPSLLSPGNIPAVRNLEDCVYRIFTTPQDATAIANSSAYARLRELVAVDVVFLRRRDDNKYVTSSDCYRAAMRDAIFEHSAAVFLIPDMVFADGGIRSIVRLLEAGKRAVLVMGLRAFKESLVPEVQTGFGREDCICIGPRDLVRLGLRNLHSIVRSHVYDGDTPGFNPSVICWKVGEEGMLVHSFHLHPVAAFPASGAGVFGGTIDDDLVQAAGLAPEQVHVVTDSDELVWFEISGRDQQIPIPTRRRIQEIVDWMDQSTSAYHREIVRIPIRVHSAGSASSAWLEAERRGREVVELFLSEYARLISGNRAVLRRWLLKLERRASALLERWRARSPGNPAPTPLKALVAFGIVLGVRAAKSVYRGYRARRS